MKNFLLTSFSMLMSIGFAIGQNTETAQEINTPVQSAIIYLYGAEVTHTKQVTLNAGRNKIVFTCLSAKLDSKSIRVNASGDVSILAISNTINYMANQKESAKIKQLRDSVTSLTDDITQINNEKDA